jgi:hypothetical protein
MTEVFELQFKNSIRYGMTYNQFWFDDPQLYYTYEEVYLDRLKEKDVLNWQLGQYITSAIGVWLGKNSKFPDKPMFYAREKEKELSMMDKFLVMMNQVNKNFN